MNLKFNQRWAWVVGDIEMIKQALVDAPHPIIHICSGSSNIGDIKLDLCPVNVSGNLSRSPSEKKNRGHPDILGDMLNIPFKSGMAGTVICDPPYDKSFFDNSGFDGLVCELVRILKPSGKLIFYSPWVITHPTLKLKEMIPQKTGKERSYFKIMSVHEKFVGQLADYARRGICECER